MLLNTAINTQLVNSQPR